VANGNRAVASATATSFHDTSATVVSMRSARMLWRELLARASFAVQAAHDPTGPVTVTSEGGELR